MSIDTFEVKWRDLDVVSSKNKSNKQREDEWYELVRYKKTSERLEEFIEATKQERLIVSLDYFINGYSFSHNMTLNYHSKLDVLGQYINNVSWPWNSSPNEINYPYENMILKRVLGQAITIEDFLSVVEWELPRKRYYQEKLTGGTTKEQMAEEMYREEMQFNVDFYGCTCRDKLCGGFSIQVTEEEDFIYWAFPFKNHRKYRFEKQPYYQAFQELADLIEKRMKKNFG